MSVEVSAWSRARGVRAGRMQAPTNADRRDASMVKVAILFRPEPFGDLKRLSMPPARGVSASRTSSRLTPPEKVDPGNMCGSARRDAVWRQRDPFLCYNSPDSFAAARAGLLAVLLWWGGAVFALGIHGVSGRCRSAEVGGPQ